MAEATVEAAAQGGGTTEGLRNLWWIEIGWVGELTDDFNLRTLTTAGHNGGRGQKIHTLLLAEGAHDDLELGVRENTGQGEDTGGDGRGTLTGDAIGQQAVDGVGGDGTTTGAIASGHWILTCDRGACPGSWINKRIVGGCNGSSISGGAAAAEVTVSNVERAEQCVEAQFLGVALGNFHKFGRDVNLLGGFILQFLNQPLNDVELLEGVFDHQAAAAGNEGGTGTGGFEICAERRQNGLSVCPCGHRGCGTSGGGSSEGIHWRSGSSAPSRIHTSGGTEKIGRDTEDACLHAVLGTFNGSNNHSVGFDAVAQVGELGDCIQGHNHRDIAHVVDRDRCGGLALGLKDEIDAGFVLIEVVEFNALGVEVADDVLNAGCVKIDLRQNDGLEFHQNGRTNFVRGGTVVDRGTYGVGNRRFPELVHFTEGAGAGVIAGGTQVVCNFAFGVFQLTAGGGIGGIDFENRVEGFLSLIELAEVEVAEALLEERGDLLGVLVMGFLHGRIVIIRIVQALHEDLGTVVVGILVVREHFLEEHLGIVKSAHFAKLVGLLEGGIGEFGNHAGAVCGAERGIGDAVDSLAVFFEGTLVISVGETTVAFGLGEAGIFNTLEALDNFGIGRTRRGTVASGIGPCVYKVGGGDAGRADSANDPGFVW